MCYVAPVRPPYLLLALAVVSGVLYACVLPLWNGFDEPFHYGYVENLLVDRVVPELGRAQLTKEIEDSFRYTPLSRLFSMSVPGTATVEQWPQLPERERVRRREELDALPTGLRKQSSESLNYEAQQAPLAYLGMAPLDAALCGLHLPLRILALRLIVVLFAAVFLCLALWELCRVLDTSPAFAFGALCCVFLTQMLWASMAHVGNDALAIPLFVYFVALLGRFERAPDGRTLLLLSIVLTAGLLTKAYFLAFVPVFFLLLLSKWVRKQIPEGRLVIAAAIVLFFAGPWYARNSYLYGSVSGTQESMHGIGIVQAISAFPKINWISNALNVARWSLWTGDWSFLSFSKPTLTIEVLLILAGLVFYAVRLRTALRHESWILAACGCFLLGLAYQSCVTWVSSNGASEFAEPWYAQGLVVCIWMLAFKGFSNAGTAGRLLAGASVVLSVWIAVVTYVMKLPLFYGIGESRSSIRNITAFWSGHPFENLSTVMLGPVWLSCISLGAFLCLLAVASVVAIRKLVRCDTL